MPDADDTVLTDRQVEVMELREQGYTQREVADQLGTSDSNVSAVERAAKENVAKARRTLELLRALRAPVRFTMPPNAEFDDLLESVYDRGDEAGVKVKYCRPELQSHLYGELEPYTDGNRLETGVTVGLTEAGEVRVYPAL
ncbi:MAG: Tfx family DNA-binding protein [Haloarculaceae archaeon]